jgi:hypothetical protein
MGARQHVDAERLVHESRQGPGARLGVFPCPVRGRGQGHSRLLRHAPVRDHLRAPAGARSQDAMADEQMSHAQKERGRTRSAGGR